VNSRLFICYKNGLRDHSGDFFDGIFLLEDLWFFKVLFFNGLLWCVGKFFAFLLFVFRFSLVGSKSKQILGNFFVVVSSNLCNEIKH